MSGAPLAAITPTGLRARDAACALDRLVCGSSFDVLTGALLGIDIRGRDGESRRRQWAAGPRTYLGLAIASLPNLFAITGPGSPAVLSHMPTSIERHVAWIADCLAYLRDRSHGTIEATAAAAEAWVAHVNAVADLTLYPRANSWYMGANIPGKPRSFMPYIGGVETYRLKCDGVAARGYAGFNLPA